MCLYKHENNIENDLHIYVIKCLKVIIVSPAILLTFSLLARPDFLVIVHADCQFGLLISNCNQREVFPKA